MSKVIAIMDKPEDCKFCTFLMCTPITKQKTREYCCNLKDGNKIAKERIYEEFGCDEEVHLSNCPLHEIENITNEGVNMYNVGYNKAIDDFYDKVLNFEDYIESIDTSEFGAVLLYSGADITRMIYDIKKQLKEGGKNE